MTIITIIDSLQKVRRYLIQRHINNISRAIRLNNMTMRALEKQRIEHEIVLDDAISRRARMIVPDEITE